jgi:hypothetical protein
LPWDAPEFPGLAEEVDEDPAEVVGEEAVVGEAVVVVAAAVVVEVPRDGAVVAVVPCAGAEAVGAEDVPVGEAALGPEALDALTAVEFAQEDVPGVKEEVVSPGAPFGGAPAGAAGRTPRGNPGSVATTRGFLMPDTSG